MLKGLEPSTINVVIQRLNGTTGFINDELEEMGFSESQLSKENFEQIDRNIFLCGYCGWWYPSSEKIDTGSEYICLTCNKYGST